LWRDLLAETWAAASGGQPFPATLEVTGDAGYLPSALPVEDLAIACTGAALLAATATAATSRTGNPPRIDRPQLAAAYRSEAHLRINGTPAPAGFAPLSAFWRTADGWIRTHANYPWHREALLRVLGTPDDKDAVAAAIAEREARDLEDAIVAGGGIAAALRTKDQWRTEPQGQAATAAPLIATRRTGHAEPRRRPSGHLPAEGVKVLDLTRVIAGPVCTRYLAALGADVLRIDPPHRPELPQQTVDSLLGKRSALLDARTAAGLATLHELLDQADVLVHGYRPHALDRFGLAPDALAARHPGLVTVALSAWGDTGPWGDRRGFDSIVQVATGIAVATSPDGDRPGALPCQLLDHGTGYLCAAAALCSLSAQQAEGGTPVNSLSLARTASLLLTAPPATPASRPLADAAPSLVTVPGQVGEVSVVAPPGELDGAPLAWRRPLTRYGMDAPAWLSGKQRVGGVCPATLR